MLLEIVISVEQLSNLTHPLLYTAHRIAVPANSEGVFGPRVLLTTGGKDLAVWRAGLAEKRCWRVLPVAGGRFNAAANWGSALEESTVWAVQRF